MPQAPIPQHAQVIVHPRMRPTAGGEAANLAGKDEIDDAVVVPSQVDSAALRVADRRQIGELYAQVKSVRYPVGLDLKALARSLERERHHPPVLRPVLEEAL